MDFLKKNLIFIAVIITLVLTSFTGLYLAYERSTHISESKQKMASAQARLKNLRFANPTPSINNVIASADNVAQLRAALESIREDLQRGNRISTSGDGISVMASIQQFISDYQRKALLQSDDNAELEPISLPDDFAFGFEQYIDEAKPLDNSDLSATLDKQRQILSYLMDKLFEAKPAAIIAVQREVFELGSSVQSSQKFEIEEAISARVPGAINTLAFSISFSSYTDTLRNLLNNLAKFDLPIIVRSIEVKRPNDNQASAALKNNDFDSIFGAFGETNQVEEPKEAQKPIISENISTFTLVLEFIEIVLPDDISA